MNTISKKKIKLFCDEHADAKALMITWYNKTVKAQWSNFSDIRKDYPSADWVGDDRVVFNIGGNRYRINVRISFLYKNVQIKWIGTHAEYNSIDAATVA